MAEYFNTPSDYIRTATDRVDRIKKIDQIIESIYDSMLDGTGNIEEYHYNDGQTVVKAIYRSLNSMQEAIDLLEARREKERQGLEGSIQHLIPSEPKQVKWRRL